jgi:hypothetical protein
MTKYVRHLPCPPQQQHRWGGRRAGPLGLFPRLQTTSPFNPRPPPHQISCVFFFSFPGEISLFFYKEIGKILGK